MERVVAMLATLAMCGCVATDPGVPAGAQTVGMLKASPGPKSTEQWLSRSTIPESFAIGTGAPPIALDVTGMVAMPAADAASAEIIASRESDEGADTMLTIKSRLDTTVKFDLYISPDGERFQYTSSCPLGPQHSNFESWPYRIHSFAIGNPRIVSENQLTCE